MSWCGTFCCPTRDSMKLQEAASSAKVTVSGPMRVMGSKHLAFRVSVPRVNKHSCYLGARKSHTVVRSNGNV